METEKMCGSEERSLQNCSAWVAREDIDMARSWSLNTFLLKNLTPNRHVVGTPLPLPEDITMGGVIIAIGKPTSQRVLCKLSGSEG